MSLFHDITEGGQTTTHRVRMFRQVLLTSTKIALALSIVYYIYLMMQVPSVYYNAVWYQIKGEYFKALNLKVSVTQEFWGKVAHQHFGAKDIEVGYDSLITLTKPLVNNLVNISLKNFYKVLVLFSSCYFFIFMFFGLRGRFRKKGLIFQENKYHLLGKLG